MGGGGEWGGVGVSKMLMHDYGGEGGASHNVDITLGGGYLMMMLGYKGVRRGQKSGKK